MRAGILWAVRQPPALHRSYLRGKLRGAARVDVRFRMNLLLLAMVVFTVHFAFATTDGLRHENLSTALVEGLASALFWGLLLLFPAFVPGWAAFLVLLGLAWLRGPRANGRVLALALSPVVGVFFYIFVLVDHYVPIQEVVTSVA